VVSGSGLLTTRNKRIWQEHGISSEGHARCDAALPLFMEAVRLAGGLADQVFAEAKFQVQQLPRLTAQAQSKFAWRPPK